MISDAVAFDGSDKNILNITIFYDLLTKMKIFLHTFEYYIFVEMVI